ARRLISGAETLKARAETIKADIEPELTLPVDALNPNGVLTNNLKRLSETFPCLPVVLYTVRLGVAEQRHRDGVARLGLYVPIPGTTDDMESEFLMTIPTVPVVAADHALAKHEGPFTRDMLEGEVQLVLTDRTPVTNGLSGGILSRRTWRF